MTATRKDKPTPRTGTLRVAKCSDNRRPKTGLVALMLSSLPSAIVTPLRMQKLQKLIPKIALA
jgi:hypothetical protein